MTIARTRTATLFAMTTAALLLSGCAADPSTPDPLTPAPEATETTITGADEQTIDSTDALQAEAMEEYVLAELIQLDASAELLEQYYSSSTVTGEADLTRGIITFTYTYLEDDSPASKPEFADTATPQLEGLVNNGVFPAMRTYGLASVIQVNYVYLSPAGEVLYSRVFMIDNDEETCHFEGDTTEAFPLSCSDVTS